jgi:hypothetical protein
MTITEARPRRSGATAASRGTSADPGTSTMDLALGQSLALLATDAAEHTRTTTSEPGRARQSTRDSVDQNQVAEPKLIGPSRDVHHNALMCRSSI